MAFCPKCRNEYRPGFTVCSDCHEQLVDNLPQEENDSDVFEPVPEVLDVSSLKFIAIFVSCQPQEANAVECILTDNKIPFIKRGNDARQFRYEEFLVREDKFLEAKDLLKDIIAKEDGMIPVDCSEVAPQEETQGKPPAVFQGKGAMEPAGTEANSFYPQVLLLIVASCLLARAVFLKSDRFILGGSAAVVLLCVIILFSKSKR